MAEKLKKYLKNHLVHRLPNIRLLFVNLFWFMRLTMNNRAGFFSPANHYYIAVMQCIGGERECYLIALSNGE
jgi:hypothetical protein